MRSMQRLQADVSHPAEAIVEQLKRSFTVGSVTVTDASYELDETSDGIPVVRFNLTLADPPPNLPTWHVNDVIALQLAVDAMAVEQGLDARWHTALHAATADDMDE